MCDIDIKDIDIMCVLSACSTAKRQRKRVNQDGCVAIGQELKAVHGKPRQHQSQLTRCHILYMNK